MAEDVERWLGRCGEWRARFSGVVDDLVWHWTPILPSQPPAPSNPEWRNGQPVRRDMPDGTSSRSRHNSLSCASGSKAVGWKSKRSWRNIGIGRADARRAWLRKRSCRAGSIEQHLMLQYFAVGLCTGSLQPTRAQMRRGMAARCECLDTPTSDVTAGVYAAAMTPCQPFRHARTRDAFDTRNLCTVWTTAHCDCAVRDMPVRNFQRALFAHVAHQTRRDQTSRDSDPM